MGEKRGEGMGKSGERGNCSGDVMCERKLKEN